MHHCCVYWSYTSDDGRYNPYNPDQSASIEKSYAVYAVSKKTKHSSVNITINKSIYELNFVSMAQRNTATGHKRSIQRVPVFLPQTPSFMAYWEWEESHGRFVPYTMQASIDIELAHMGGHPTVDLSTTNVCIPYTIDMTNMCQVRHRYNTRRNIRRVALRNPLHELLKDQLSNSKKTSIAASSVSGSKKPTAAKVTTRSRPTTTACTVSIPPLPVTPAVLPPHYSTIGHVTSTPFGTSSHVTSIPSGTGGHVTSTHFSSSSHMPSMHMGIPGHVTSVPFGASGHVTSIPTGTTGHVTSIPSSTIPAPTMSSSTKPKKAKKSPPKTAKSSTKAGKKAKKSDQGAEVTPSNDSKDDILMKYVKTVSLNFGQNEPCPICMSDLTEFSGFEEDVGLPAPPTGASSSGSSSLPDICKLRRCGHMLHKACLIMYMKNKSDGLICPTCKKIHGVKTGDMPNGTMTHRISSYSLPGHPEHNTIEVTYNFTSGTQNGRRYNANGFPRTCYIPNSPKGQKVFKLLQVAWKRRLTFTIGTSVTTGATNTIVWNEIHHKTEAHGNSTGHGYPDNNYLDNALAELAAQGVEEGQDDDDGDNGNMSDSDDDL